MSDLKTLIIEVWSITLPMSKFAKSHSEMEFYFIQLGPIRSYGGSRDKGHCRFPYKEEKEGGKLKISFDFALNFIVMRQEEATKDRRWLQVGTK